MKDVFGELQKGSLEDPAVISGSVHYFFKEVSGAPLIRPDWYFDTDQEGEGIVDVTTHMIDLIQWACFPDVDLDYKKDIQMLAAKHWATKLNPAQFRQVTNRNDYPAFLRKDVKDSLLNVYSNGEMNYTIRATHVRVSVNWEFEAPKGSGDTFYSILRGTKANLVIRQGAEQQYKPVLYIEPVMKDDQNNWKQAVEKELDSIRETYPGLELKENKTGWKLIIPEKYKIGHEQQFALGVKKYLQFLRAGKMPEWEVAAMLAKYYTTTQALEKAMGR